MRHRSRSTGRQAGRRKAPGKAEALHVLGGELQAQAPHQTARCACSSTGLLIPKIAGSVPVIYGQDDRASVIKQFVDGGYLKLDDIASDYPELLIKGLDGIPGFKEFADLIQGSYDGRFHLTGYPLGGGIGNHFMVGPVYAVLSKARAHMRAVNWVTYALNTYPILTGPDRMRDVVNNYRSIEPNDEAEQFFEPDYLQYGVNEKGEYSRPPADASDEVERIDPELAQIIRDMYARRIPDKETKASLGESGWGVCIWEPQCHAFHAWESEYDNGCEAGEFFAIDGSVAEIAERMAAINHLLEPLNRLETWTNSKSKLNPTPALALSSFTRDVKGQSLLSILSKQD